MAAGMMFLAVIGSNFVSSLPAGSRHLTACAGFAVLACLAGGGVSCLVSICTACLKSTLSYSSTKRIASPPVLQPKHCQRFSLEFTEMRAYRLDETGKGPCSPCRLSLVQCLLRKSTLPGQRSA